MADEKFTDQAEDTAPATNDWVPTVDVSDTTMGADGTNKKVTRANLLGTNLSTYSGIAPLANVQSILAAANYAAIKALLELEIGTDVQAWNANLDTYAGITPETDIQALLAAADYAAALVLLSLTPGTDIAGLGTANTYTGTNTWTGILALGNGSALTQIQLNVSPADLTWSGPMITVVAGETLAAGQLLYSKNDGGAEKFYLYDADGADKYHPPRALALATIASGDPGLAGIGSGIFRNDAWAMTANQDEGKEVWASVTPGGIVLVPPSTSGDQLANVGYVKEVNIVQFNLGNVVPFEVP